MQVHVRRIDLQVNADCRALIELLNHYALQETGQSAALADAVLANVIADLKQETAYQGWLAEFEDRAVGLANCFKGFSTFRSRPLVNIHDLVVHREYQGQGIGCQLLQSVIQQAKDDRYCAVTLEVLADNPAARLYQRMGFEGIGPSVAGGIMYFGKLSLAQDGELANE